MDRLAFAHPAYLWGLAAAALPLAIHLFHQRRPRPLPFGAMELLLRSQLQKRRQLRLRQLLLLLARLLLVCAVALALARPSLVPRDAAAASALGPQATALLLDASLSMRYRLEGRTLFERARAEALAALDRLSAEEPATVGVCAGPDGLAGGILAPSFDRAATRRALQAAEPSFLASDLTSCLAQAARALGESQVAGKRILAFTDLSAHAFRLDAPPPLVPPAPGTPASAATRPTVALIDAAQGSALPNAAIVQVEARPAPRLGARGTEVVATVANFGAEPIAGLPLGLRVGGQQVSKGFVDLPPRGTAKKSLSAVLPPGLQLGRVELGRQEAKGLDEDDARDFALLVPRDLRVLAIDGAPSALRSRDEAWFVETALSSSRSGGQTQLSTIDADAAEARSLDEVDVVLLLDVPAPKRPFATKLAAFVERGGGLLIALGDHADPEAYDEALGPLLPRPLRLLKSAGDPAAPEGEPGPTGPPARFGWLDGQHPIFRPFSPAEREALSSARTFRYALLEAQGRKDARTLISFDDGAPALVEAPLGAGRVLLLTTSASASWTDWPLRPSFLPVLQQAVGYLGGALEERAPTPARVGEERVLLPANGQRIVGATGPDGGQLPLRRDAASQATSVRADLPGSYRVQVAPADGAGPARDEPQLAFAAALDPRESDLARVDEREISSQLGGKGSATVAASSEQAQGPRGTPLWTGLLLLAVLALLAEGILTRR